MVACKAYETLMSEALAGEQSDGDRAKWDKHLDRCEACARSFAELQETVRLVKKGERPQLDEFYWSGFMDRLDRRLDDELRRDEERRGSERPLWRRISLPFAAAALIVAGVLIGRLSVPKTPGYVESGQEAQNTMVARGKLLSGKGESQLFLAHLGRLEPLLLDLRNQHPAEGRPTVIEEALLRDLLMQNRILKRLFARQNESVKQALLDDLELILLEMTTGSESEDGIGKLIEDKGLLLKLKVLGNRSKNL